MFKRITKVRTGAFILMACTAGLLFLSSGTALAQAKSLNHDSMNHGSMDMGDMKMGGVDHGSMDMDDMKMPSGHDAMTRDDMNHEAVIMQQRRGATVPYVERATYARTGEGECEPPIEIAPATGAPACWPGPVMDQEPYGKFLIDELELGYTDGADGYSWEVDAFWGDDYDKIWFESEGEGLQDGGVESAGVQVLYSHLITPFLGIQAGLRYDFEPDPGRAFAVLGVEGLAPYFFEVDASLFVSEDGDVSFGGEVEYELLFTQRLILTPSFEITLAAQNVPEYGLGSGLRSTVLGLRLRYEIQREFAPYIGVSYEQLYGDTKDFAEAAGEETSRTAFVIGIQAWF